MDQEAPVPYFTFSIHACRHLEKGKTSAFIPDMELREEWQDEEFPR